jgi:hypothetical protein
VIYNGIVFKEHGILDAPDFQIDDGVFTEVCGRLSHPDAYDFNEIPIHILGSIYERFLANVIVLKRGRVKIEQKPEVKKAGGVYYTPDHIVRYIVDNTVGRMIEGRTPKHISTMRFGDIACGSGSFLLGVYDVLLKYMTRYYNDHPGKAGKRDCVKKDNVLHLSLEKRRNLLLDNVFGVDIDGQAVEVTQLSLYLKLLEDTTLSAARGFRQRLLHTAILPTLTENIVCGNSVIGPDILQNGLFPAEEEEKLNPMAFEDRFPAIMREGGFDAVVGNPPYVRPHRLAPVEKQYFWDHFDTFTHKSDLYCCFIERVSELLKPCGMFSYIVSHGWLRLNSFQRLRQLILATYRVLQIADMRYKVFPEASVKTCIFVLKKDDSAGRLSTKIEIIEGHLPVKGPTFDLVKEIPQRTFLNTFQNVFDLSITRATARVKKKMAAGPTFESQFRVCFGLKTGDDEKFLHHKRGLHAEDRRLLRGEDVHRYRYTYQGEYVWYVPKRMRAHRSTARPGEPERFEQPKVLVRDTTTDFSSTYDDNNYYVKDVLIVLPREDVIANYDLRFVTGILNSKALWFFYRTTFDTLHVQQEELSSLPLPRLDLTQRTDRDRHKSMIGLVTQMLAAQQQLAKARSDRDKDYTGNKCVSLDRQIDQLAYKLYELDADDIAIVEAELRRVQIQNGEEHAGSEDDPDDQMENVTA